MVFNDDEKLECLQIFCEADGFSDKILNYNLLANWIANWLVNLLTVKILKIPQEMSKVSPSHVTPKHGHNYSKILTLIQKK